MSPTTFTPFAAEHLEGAAQVLERRHHIQQQMVGPMAQEVDFLAQVTSAFQEASGSVALRDGIVVGYLLGKAKSDDGGPHIWSHVAGHSCDDEDLVGDLYALAAKGWVETGLTRHFIFAPAPQEFIEPWFRLGFGASAYLATRAATPDPKWVNPGLTIRRVETTDVNAVARLERSLFLSLRESPSFSDIEIESPEEFEQSWISMQDDERYVAWCAEVDGSVVGELFLYRRPEGDLRVPPKSIDLSSASVDPHFRRRGIARALTHTALTWASENDFETIITDWRATNLTAAKTWPQLGFEPTFIRLQRSIP